MIDERINENAVLRAIYQDKGHTIWSPCTTLSRMGVEQYPNLPKDNRLAMKLVLSALHEKGLLKKRPQLHSHYTFKEVAYERVADVDVQGAGKDEEKECWEQRK